METWMKRERKTQHTEWKILRWKKNNKLNKLYVSADIAGAHINPVGIHEIIYESSREPATTFSAIFMKFRRVAYTALPIWLPIAYIQINVFGAVAFVHKQHAQKTKWIVYTAIK